MLNKFFLLLIVDKINFNKMKLFQLEAVFCLLTLCGYCLSFREAIAMSNSVHELPEIPLYSSSKCIIAPFLITAVGKLMV